MQGYREAAPAPANSVVVYYPYGPLGRYVYVALFVAVGLVLGYLMITEALTQVRVHCDREEGACVVTTARPILGSTSTSLPLSIIKDAQPRLSSGKNRFYYVVLRTTGNYEESVGGHGRDTEAQATAATLNAFLLTPSAPSVDVETNPTRTGVACWYGFLMLGFSMVGFYFMQTARIEVLWKERIFRLISYRWPLRTRTRDFPLEAVRDAFLTQGRSRNGTVYGVSLRIDDEVDVPLPGDKSSWIESKERAVTEIKDLLRLRDGGGPTIEG